MNLSPECKGQAEFQYDSDIFYIVIHARYNNIMEFIHTWAQYGPGMNIMGVQIFRHISLQEVISSWTSGIVHDLHPTQAVRDIKCHW